MFTSNCSYIVSSVILLAFVIFQVFVSSVSSVLQSDNYNNTYQKLRPRDESEKLKHIRDYLKKINKQAVMTIQSPDGDTIDCVLTHQQPAFDHPQLIGQKPMDPPNKMPKWVISSSCNKTFKESFQLWSKSGESCPENTIPIRRTTEQDILRANSVRTFGRKTVTRNSYYSDDHEHAVGLVSSDEYYGAGAFINVWSPHVEEEGEISLSQIWLTAGSPNDHQNTIEVGWEVYPEKKQHPRLFTYWTSDSYKTGCYNLDCPGFVQICNNIALGAAIWPVSSYNGRQYDIPISVYKNRTDNNWWLWVNGNFVGYWPSFLFTHLKDHATMVEFGGEIVNTKSSGTHTSTRMGSGHFPGKGFGKASYFRNLQVVKGSNQHVLVNVTNLTLMTENENCYDIQMGKAYTQQWGAYFYYGGRGRGTKCP